MALRPRYYDGDDEADDIDDIKHDVDDKGDCAKTPCEDLAAKCVMQWRAARIHYSKLMRNNSQYWTCEALETPFIFKTIKLPKTQTVYSFECYAKYTLILNKLFHYLNLVF